MKIQELEQQMEELGLAPLSEWQESVIIEGELDDAPWYIERHPTRQIQIFTNGDWWTEAQMILRGHGTIRNQQDQVRAIFVAGRGDWWVAKPRIVGVQ